MEKIVKLIPEFNVYRIYGLSLSVLCAVRFCCLIELAFTKLTQKSIFKQGAGHKVLKLCTLLEDHPFQNQFQYMQHVALHQCTIHEGSQGFT